MVTRKADLYKIVHFHENHCLYNYTSFLKITSKCDRNVCRQWQLVWVLPKVSIYFTLSLGTQITQIFGKIITFCQNWPNPTPYSRDSPTPWKLLLEIEKDKKKKRNNFYKKTKKKSLGILLKGFLKSINQEKNMKNPYDECG